MNTSIDVRPLILVVVLCAVASFGCGSTAEYAAPRTELRGSIADAPKLFTETWEGHEGETLYVTPDEFPNLVGGVEGLNDRVVRYRAGTACPTGRILIQLLVGEDGTVLDTRTRSGAGHPCEEAAIRALRASRFTPGKEDGTPVKTVFAIPVTIKR